MNQIPGKNPRPDSNENGMSQQFVTAPNVQPTPCAQPNRIEPSSEHVEPAADGVFEQEVGFPTVDQPKSQNYDVQDYARLASQSPTPARQSGSERYDSEFVRQFGESDPYVDPAELAKDDLQNTLLRNVDMEKEELTSENRAHSNEALQLDSAVRTVAEIEEFQQQLEQLESEAAQCHSAPTGPTVEIIGANPIAHDVESKSENAESCPTDLPEDAIPPVSWFEIEMADQADAADTPISLNPVPIVNLETGEPVFDVRDFCDSVDGVIEPIPGSFEVDPEFFEFETIDELDEQRQPSSHETAYCKNSLDATVGHITDDQVFVAGTGDIIQVNGSDGFDHIDLACFDVKWATFSEQVIQVNEPEGSSFEVHYQDVGYALFADGIEVRLDANKNT